MRLSNRQKAALAIARKAAGLDDPAYRLILCNLAGVASAKDRRWRRVDYIAVMAILEDRADGRLPGFTPGYWQGEARRADAGDALRHRARQAAGAMGWTEEDLSRFVASTHMSSGRFATIDDMPPVWLAKALEALKAMAERRITK